MPKIFIRYSMDILCYHRFETGSGTFVLPRAADISDLHWRPISSLQLWHWTPVRQCLPQEHICCKVPDIKHSWGAHQEEDNPYPLLLSTNLFNGLLQAILCGRHFFLQKHGRSVINILVSKKMAVSWTEDYVLQIILNGIAVWIVYLTAPYPGAWFGRDE